MHSEDVNVPGVPIQDLEIYLYWAASTFPKTIGNIQKRLFKTNTFSVSRVCISEMADEKTLKSIIPFYLRLIFIYSKPWTVQFETYREKSPHFKHRQSAGSFSRISMVATSAPVSRPPSGS